MSSSWGEQGRSVSSTTGAAQRDHIVFGPVGWKWCLPGEGCEGVTEIYRCTNYTPTKGNHFPKPQGGRKRLTKIEPRRVHTTMSPNPPRAVIFIFVQGKESACIVTRDLGEDKDERMCNVKRNLYNFADPRLGTTANTGQEFKHAEMYTHAFARMFREAATFRKEFEQPAEMYPYAYVCAVFDADDVNEEKRSKPSSHKESSSRPLNEKAAIDFLSQRLENGDFKETIQTAISALQCLYQENIKADEIEVYAAHVDTAHVIDTHKFLSRWEIEMHLAAFNLNLNGPGLENAGV